MIKLSGKICIPTNAYANVRAALDEHIALTRAEAGCMKFEVAQDTHDAEIFHVYEEFATRADFDLHQTLGKARKWGALSANFQRDFALEEIDG